MEHELPILEEMVMDGEEAIQKGVQFADRSAILTPEEASEVLRPSFSEIPDSWIETAVREAVQSHLNAIADSALNRLRVRRMLNSDSPPQKSS